MFAYVKTNNSHGTQVPSTSSLCYFDISSHDPVPKDSSELCILSNTGLTVIAETSIVSLSVSPQQTRLISMVGTIMRISYYL